MAGASSSDDAMTDMVALKARLKAKIRMHSKKRKKHDDKLRKYKAMLNSKFGQSSSRVKAGQPEDSSSEARATEDADGSLPMRHKKHLPPQFKQGISKPDRIKPAKKGRPAGAIELPPPYNFNWVQDLANKMGHANFQQMMDNPLFKQHSITQYTDFKNLVVSRHIRREKVRTGNKHPVQTTLNEWKRLGTTYASESFSVIALADPGGAWEPGDVEGCLKFFRTFDGTLQTSDEGAAFWIVHKIFPGQFPANPEEKDKKKGSEYYTPWNAAYRHATAMKRTVELFLGSAADSDDDEEDDEDDDGLSSKVSSRVRQPTEFMTASRSTKATSNYVAKPARPMRQM